MEADRWTREEFAAALRAEIERDGVPCYVSDGDLLEAYFSPLRRAHIRWLRAYAALGKPAQEAADAITKLRETIQRGEDFEDMFSDVRNLPEIPYREDAPVRPTPHE